MPDGRHGRCDGDHAFPHAASPKSSARIGRLGRKMTRSGHPKRLCYPLCGNCAAPTPFFCRTCVDDAPRSVGGFPSTAEETEYCAEESSDRAKRAKDDRGNGIQHRYDRVRGRARRDHDNAETRCDKQRRETLNAMSHSRRKTSPLMITVTANASNQAARRRRPCDRLIGCVHNRLSGDGLVQRDWADSGLKVAIRPRAVEDSWLEAVPSDVRGACRSISPFALTETCS